MVIGITGGEEEEIRGEPLVGPSGRKTTRALQWGAGSESSRLTIRKYNLFNCRARKPGVYRKFVNRKGNEVKISEFRACCERWLFPELRTTKAKLVLCFGADVYKFLFKASNGYQFDVFGKAMGHRLCKPQLDITPQGLGKRIVTYGKTYET